MVVEHAIQEKDIVRVQVERQKLATEFLEGPRSETTGDQRSEMLAAEINFHRDTRTMGKSEIPERAENTACCAAPALRPFNHGIEFAYGQ